MRPLLVDSVAAYRLTRLATTDVITAPVRDELVAFAYVARDGDRDAEDRKRTHGGTWSEIARDDLEPPWLATLVTCRWCSGWWIACLIVWARRRHPRAWGPVAEACTLSAAAGLLARLERQVEQRLVLAGTDAAHVDEVDVHDARAR